jgi:hypothetical protein
VGIRGAGGAVFVATPKFTFLSRKKGGWPLPDWLHTPQQGPRPAAGCRVAAEPPPSPAMPAANKRILHHADGLCGIVGTPFSGDPSHQRPLCGPEFSDVYSIGPDYLRPVYAALCVRFSGMTAETTSALVICRPLTPGPQKVTNHTTGKPHKSRA